MFIATLRSSVSMRYLLTTANSGIGGLSEPLRKPDALLVAWIFMPWLGRRADTGEAMSEKNRPDYIEEKQAPKHETPGQDNLADAKRRGSRRTSGHDTPSGPNTDRSVTPAKEEQERS